MSEQYKMYLVLGDWSDDGHGKTDKVLIETNYPVGIIQQAYRDSCKLTGVSFNHNEDYTETNRDWQETKKYRIATEYESGGSLTNEVTESLRPFDTSGVWEPGTENEIKYESFLDFYNEEPNESFNDLWFWFVKLSLPELTYKVVTDDIPVINGYWNKDLNVQFGYGLYW